MQKSDTPPDPPGYRSKRYVTFRRYFVVWPVVLGAGAGILAAGGAEPVGAEPVVVAAGGVGTLLAVVSLTWPRVNTNISTSANTTAPATQPHIAFEDSNSFKRCDRISSSRSGGGYRKRGSDMAVSLVLFHL